MTNYKFVMIHFLENQRMVKPIFVDYLTYELHVYIDALTVLVNPLNYYSSIKLKTILT